MPALRVDEHGVHAHGIDLPLPPHVRAVVALAAADAIRALARFQHQPLAAKRARRQADRVQRFPCLRLDRRAHAKRQALASGCRGVEDALDKAFERGAAFALRQGAHVAAVKLKEIVGDEGDRQFAHRLLAHHLAAEAPLEARERREALKRMRARLVFRSGHDHKLAVERRPRRQSPRQRLEVGIAVGDELLPARPQAPALAASDQLRADAVELPLDDPIRGGPERLLHLRD